MAEGGGSTEPTVQLHFGVIDSAGVKVASTEMHADFQGPAATVTVTFPGVAVDGQRWWLEFPANMRVQHIWEESLGRQDVLPAWGFDASHRRYTSPPQTAGFQGFYSIAVTTVGG